MILSTHSSYSLNMRSFSFGYWVLQVKQHSKFNRKLILLMNINVLIQSEQNIVLQLEQLTGYLTTF